MLRLFRCSTLFSAQTLNPKPTSMTMMPKALSRSVTFLTREDILSDDNPAKRLMELGEFALRTALKQHLSATYPHLTAQPLAALQDVIISDEKLTLVADRLKLEVHEMVVGLVIRAGIAFEEPVPDSAIAFAGMKYVDCNYDMQKFWKLFKVLLEPMETPEDLDKLTEGELEKQRASGAQALSRRPIKFLFACEILRDENPVQRLKELGAYALKFAVTKHIATTYPELFGRSLNALRDANICRVKLASVAYHLVAKEISWPKENELAFKVPMSDSLTVLAGRMYVDTNYDIDKFWMMYKGYLEPLLTPEDLEKCGIQVNCYPFLTNNEISHGHNGFQRYRERGEFALRVSLKNHFAATYQELGNGTLTALLEANLSKEMLVRVTNRLSVQSSIKQMRDRGLAYGQWEAALPDYAVFLAGYFYVACNYDLYEFWKGFKEFLDPIITLEDLEEQRAGV